MSTANHPSVFQRLLRTSMRVTVTALVVAFSGLAVAFGSDFLAERAEAGGVAVSAERIPVSVTPLTLSEGYALSRHFVGQVEAAADVALSFELGGRLSDLLVDEGAHVEAGQLLARLDTALLLADRDRLEASQAATAAQLDFAESRLGRVLSLGGEGFASVEAVDQARATRDELRARMAETAAALQTVDINIGKSDLVAPFDGRVGLRNVDGGETLAAGAPVLSLIRSGETQVRVGLPLSLDATEFKTAEIAVNGQTYPARLSRMRPDLDPVTRTRTAIFVLETADIPTFGQTATLILETQVAAQGIWVPLDALQEGAGGVWTVLVVDDDKVRGAAVEILHAEAERAYVRGTFSPGALLVDTGAHRVVPGQQVRVQMAEDQV